MKIKKNHILIPLALILVLIICLYGCGGVFDVQVKNASQRELTNVSVFFNKTDLGGGLMIPNAQATYLNASDMCSIPKKAFVKWTTPEGKQISKYVEVKKHIPTFFKEIEIQIIINPDDTVSVKWEKE